MSELFVGEQQKKKQMGSRHPKQISDMEAAATSGKEKPPNNFGTDAFSEISLLITSDTQ